MTWRKAKSIEVAFNEINKLSPSRDRSSDGTIGDASHASRSSDHNPWVMDGNVGVVTAFDITHDPDKDDVSGNEIAGFLHQKKDPRVKYVIWNRKIWNPSVSPDWRNYTGSNPHDHHIHTSVLPTKALYDSTAEWSFKSIITPGGQPIPVPTVPVKTAALKVPVYVYLMYGLGYRIWSAGMEDVLGKDIRQLPGVFCPAARGFTEYGSIVDDIKKQPAGSKTVVIGHSLGAVSATKVTDYVKVDLLVLYDLAGGAPSLLGNNTKHCIDIYDTIPDMVPEWRVQTVAGQEGKVELWHSRYGHTGVDDSEEIAQRVVAEVKELI